jgi:hypothetical protein
LVIWDRRVVEKIEECVGEYIVACSFINIEDGFFWAFIGVYGPNYDRDKKGTYWRSCMVCLVGRTCCGALVEISTSLTFLVKDKVKLVLAPL